MKAKEVLDEVSRHHELNYYQDAKHTENPEHKTLTDHGFKYKETKRYYGSVGHQYTKPGHMVTVFTGGHPDRGTDHQIKKTHTTHVGIKDLDAHLTKHGL
jgi:hypothetical protein